MNTHIVDSRELIFYYEYLHKYKAKIEKALNVVKGTYAKLNYPKKSKNMSHCHVPLRDPGM